MTRTILILALCVAPLFSVAQALDLPFDFQIGFKTVVIPAADDTSQALGLDVHVEKTLKSNAELVVTGMIINRSDIPYHGVEMHFAVSSHLQTGLSRGKATVKPDFIPPGHMATFEAFIGLDNSTPKEAMYTITAQPSSFETFIPPAEFVQ